MYGLPTEQEIADSGDQTLMNAYLAGVVASRPMWEELKITKRMLRSALAALDATQCEACKYGPDDHCPRHQFEISQRKPPQFIRIRDTVLTHQPEGFRDD